MKRKGVDISLISGQGKSQLAADLCYANNGWLMCKQAAPKILERYLRSVTENWLRWGISPSIRMGLTLTSDFCVHAWSAAKSMVAHLHSGNSAHYYVAHDRLVADVGYHLGAEASLEFDIYSKTCFDLGSINFVKSYVFTNFLPFPSPKPRNWLKDHLIRNNSWE